MNITLDTTEAIKARLTKHLPYFNPNTMEQFYSVPTNKFSGLFYFWLLICLGTLMCEQTTAALIFALLSILSIRRERHIAKQRLEVLANAVAENIYTNRLKSLDNIIDSETLRSLKEIGWNANFQIVFTDCNNLNFNFEASSSSSPRSKQGNGNYDNSTGTLKIVDGVECQFKYVRLTLRCDFRYRRSELSQEEVSHLFRKMSLCMPGISADAINIYQRGGTKSFLFDKNYIDAGTISFINSKANNRKRTISNPVERSKRNKTETVTAANKTIECSPKTRSSIADKKVRKASHKQKTIFIQEILEKRKRTELRAMRAVMQYERDQGRQPVDVSSKDLGYDILSTAKDQRKLLIEVKGLGSSGDIVLTANEVSTSQKNPGQWYLYIVENCLSGQPMKLYVHKGLNSEDLVAHPAEYEISMKEQKRHSSFSIDLI